MHSVEPGAEVRILGWVRTRRDSKKFSFLELNDGSCLKNIQVVADTALEGFEQNVLKADTGAALDIQGSVVESPGKGQPVEVQASRVVLVGECSSEDYPLQKKTALERVLANDCSSAAAYEYIWRCLSRAKRCCVCHS